MTTTNDAPAVERRGQVTAATALFNAVSLHLHEAANGEDVRPRSAGHLETQPRRTPVRG